MALIVSRTATLHGALRAAERRWLRHLDDALCARQLSPDQWSMLCNLSADTGITMSQLAAKSQLAPSSATRHADALAERGLIFRVAAEEDRRRILIGLSARGVELVEAVRADEALAEQRIRATLGGRRYEELLRLLEIVAEA
ncbi:MAG TPA: MarR family transcriptional regulator [Nocardia sp.]|uniref:MarR family winged helix-turn-helix transcriptional regulator n=1 Tax=Nocardia TaxID=1817 RepID=UPI002456A9C2|nr:MULTISPECIES: MarR family transcriptional regulator [Nocardia]HLS78424.1 MarR family transcriptional regulator [Nocardia sp.]